MAERETTVLFAGIVGGGKADADGAHEDMARLAQALVHAAKVSNGRIAHRREREAMALFASPDAAARAALRLHAYALTLPPMAAGRDMRISLHTGPVGQRGEDIFGDTVDLALELLDAAGPGEALISAHAAAGLEPKIRRFVEPLTYGGKSAGRLQLGEVVSGSDGRLFAQREGRVRLRLAYRSKSIVRRREGDAATIGSDAACDLAVQDRDVSRSHCTISRRQGACVLLDHSDNGTFVKIEGDGELTVRGGEISLSGRGVISFGRPSAGNDEVVHYSCEV